MNVKLNDNVLIITGKYAGKQGRVVATSPKKGTVTVEGVNIHKRTSKAKRANEVSKIVEKEAPIDVSNVMVICGACNKAVRIRYSVENDKKVRVCPKCGAVLDKAYTGKNADKAEKVNEAPKKRTRKRAKKDESNTAADSGKAE